MKKLYQFILVVIIIIINACVKKDITPESEVVFSESYISQHRGKYFIEIPEVYELAHVVMAIKYQNSKNDYFIKKNTSYFQEVLSFFNDYKSLNLFEKFNYYETDLENNYAFRTNSYRYSLENNSIISKEMYPVMWYPDIFTSLRNDIENFAIESEFNDFYLNHLNFYQSQISLYDSIVPIYDIWHWLEGQFTPRYDCYKILISPLTTGSHNTKSNETTEFKETLMFVSGLNRETDLLDTTNIILNIRYVFTEIDHNYVNPVSDKYKDELTSIMTNLTVWKSEHQINELYDNAYLIFNEYMTWAVFDIYISEKYPEIVYKNTQQKTIDKMESGRGFIKFREFEDYLIDLYNARSDNENIEDLYPQIIDWIEKNN